MVDWLAGNRVRGTSAERTTSAGFNDVAAISGGWVELGRTTLGSANATIDVTSLADKRYLMMLCTSTGQSAGANTGSQFNADTGSSYSTRRSNNGGADYTDINFSDMEAASTGTTPYFQVAYASNLASKEKLLQSWLIAQTTAGAGTAPFRNESVGKWANTSNAVSSYQWITSTSATFDSGSEVVVLGWDPADTHTTNFWEELASVELGVAGNDLSSGTISAKKYLWVQAYAKATGGNINNGFRFNSDTGSNYANRRSVDGATDATQINTSSACDDANLDSAYERFYNMFIVNNSSNEKLSICHVVQQNASGAANAPRRGEYVGKWANTSNQITDITLHNFSGGNLDTGSIIKVWGSD